MKNRVCYVVGQYIKLHFYFRAWSSYNYKYESASFRIYHISSLRMFKIWESVCFVRSDGCISQPLTFRLITID